MRDDNTNNDTGRQGGIRVTLWGALGNILLSLMKFAAGIVGHSRALVADGVHSLSDLGSDLVVIGGLRLAARPEDRTHRYGHGKYEALATLVLGGLLGLAGLGIAVSAMSSALDMLKGSVSAPPRLVAVIAAALSILVKEGLFQWTRSEARRIDSPALMANAYHHRSDALSSVATLSGVLGAMLLGERGRILDPLAALVVAGMILVAAWRILQESGNELLEAAVEPDVEKEILEIIQSVPGAMNLHQLRTRRVGPRMVIDLHLDVDARLSLSAAHAISQTAEDRLRNAFGRETIIYIHIEPGDIVSKTHI
ncbi:MAG TPA: cation transporter [Candidatus Aminicenantes bacterium]|nr:cation transporter [Candidatus Aminicenantes bacterium]